MDRDELQDRIRARRSGGDPYRRGGTPDEERAYQRYEPDPNDAAVRHAQRTDDRRRDLFDESAAAAAGGAAAPDVTRDRDEWSRPAAIPTPASAPPPPDYAAPPSDLPLADEAGYEEVAYPAPGNVDNFDDEAYEEGAYPYEYEDWDQEGERRPGAGAVAILGFLALGVLALLGGAVLAGVFNGDPGTGQLDPTPTASASVAASVTPTDTQPPVEATPAPSGQPGASGDPVVFPDGFTARAEPCLPGSAGASGCDSNGASNGGVVDIWVGFEQGSGRDVVGATVVSPDGSTADGSIDLSRIGCSEACRGWTYFPFRNLTPGTYEVQITRNGEPAGSTSFEVAS
jgi:hypothetical protein